MKLTPLFAAALGLSAVAFPATAGTDHVQVVAASPAQGSKVAAPRSLSLTFNQAQQPSAVGVSVVMTAMPGMANHGEMVIRNFTPSWSKDGRTVTLSLRQPLRAGTYDLRWQTAGIHKMSGKVTFDVK